MSMKYLGEHFDIHCGGIDHVSVHHPNEIAQTEAATGKTWVNWWMHGEFLVIGDDEDEEGTTKMAKSGENFLTLDVVVERGYDPLAYRYFCLNAHYRSPLTFSWEGLDGAANAFDRLKNRVMEFKKDGGSGAVSGAYMETFREAVEDDLNMPRALAAMWGLLRDDSVSPGEMYATLLKMDEVLGLGFEGMKAEQLVLDEEVERLVQERTDARKRRDFATADRIRDELFEGGIILEDTPEGTKFRRRRVP